jgi:hypothetical protein
MAEICRQRSGSLSRAGRVCAAEQAERLSEPGRRYAAGAGRSFVCRPFVSASGAFAGCPLTRFFRRGPSIGRGAARVRQPGCNAVVFRIVQTCCGVLRANQAASARRLCRQLPGRLRGHAAGCAARTRAVVAPQMHASSSPNGSRGRCSRRSVALFFYKDV